MSGPTLSAKLDPDILLRLGDIKKATAAVSSGIKDIERDAYKADQAGKQLDAATVDRLKRFEAVDAKIRTLTKEDEDLIKSTQKFIGELNSTQKYADAAAKAAKIQTRLAKQEAQEMRTEVNRTARSLQGLHAVIGGDVARKLISGQGIDAGDIARLAVSSERAVMSAAKKLFGESEILKTLRTAFRAAPVIGEAIAAGMDAADRVAANKKFDRDFGRQIGSGRASAGEQLAFESQFADSIFRRFGLDPQKAVENVRSAGGALSGVHASEFEIGQARAGGDLRSNLAEELTGKEQEDLFEKSVRKVSGKTIGTNQWQAFDRLTRDGFTDTVRKEREKLIARNVEITPEVENRLREDAVKLILGQLEAGGQGKFAKQLGDEIRNQVEKRNADDSRRIKDRYEVETEAAIKRRQDFVQDNFRREMYARWRADKVPAHIAD